ncbi:YdeI/OmpD-associated family protein [Microlunatus antarcticus]|uniref:Uncharacterized protein YdeI (YjbR/CyaY-like superfamily) n=1 Tax=Microlunatus antarcticus TaxID=53388 RepID=A0A7W5P899_9ACTN|nr:uncharacterized protein YdeI (YjbR/CyaY-like superfamily) [Microlunatus antarcticus]
MAQTPRVELEQLEVTDLAELQAWLAEHHTSAPGVWLVTWKRSADPERHVAYEAVVRECLRVGWIDGQARGVDEGRSAIRLTPRRPGSGWARTNQQRVAELEAAGLMLPRGQAVVDEARSSGAWTLLDDAETLTEPPELAAALDTDPEARRQWDAFPRSPKRAALVWLGSAKRAATREKRVTEIVSRASQGLRTP